MKSVSRSGTTKTCECMDHSISRERRGRHVFLEEKFWYVVVQDATGARWKGPGNLLLITT